MKHSCIVFDIDDTLFLERDYVRSGFVAISEWVQSDLHRTGFLEIAWRIFETGRRSDIFDLAFAEMDISVDSDLINLAVQIYRCHLPDIHLLPDTKECFKYIKESGGNIAVVSDGPPESQRRKSEALGLPNFADQIILTGERGVDYAKPSSLGFLEIQNLFGVESSRCVYFADNPMKDFLGPNRLGWTTIRVIRPEGLYSSLDSEGNYRAKISVQSLLEPVQEDLI